MGMGMGMGGMPMMPPQNNMFGHPGVFPQMMPPQTNFQQDFTR